MHLNRKWLVAALLGSGFVSAPAIAAEVTSVAAGDWAAPTTWSDNAAVSAENDYVISGNVVSTPNSTPVSPATHTFAGKSLSVGSGGTLELLRTHSASLQTMTYVVPNLSIAGGTLETQGSTGSNTFNITNPVQFSGNSVVQMLSGSFTNSLNFNGGITGSGEISFYGDQGSSARDSNTLKVFGVDNAFSGNWTVTNTSADTNRTSLSAGASGALGTGTVTVGTQGDLQNDSAGGINSLAGVTLTNTGRLILSNAWSNTSATLTMASTSTLDLSTSSSSIGGMSIAGNTLGQGLYTAADLTALGYGGTFVGAGTIELIPEPASLSLVAIGMIGLARRRRR